MLDYFKMNKKLKEQITSENENFFKCAYLITFFTFFLITDNHKFLLHLEFCSYLDTACLDLFTIILIAICS